LVLSATTDVDTVTPESGRSSGVGCEPTGRLAACSTAR
jgi:hypothetical protein